MAHEIGHYIQKQSDPISLGRAPVFQGTIVRRKINGWFEDDDPVTAFQLYTEMYQWIQGMRFIPIELIDEYKQLQREQLSTYTKNCIFYPTELFIRSPYKKIMDSYARRLGMNFLGRKSSKLEMKIVNGQKEYSLTRIYNEFR